LSAAPVALRGRLARARDVLKALLHARDDPAPPDGTAKPCSMAAHTSRSSG